MLSRKKGQVRILEALITCLIILSSLSVVIYLRGVYEFVETSELEAVGESILNILSDPDVIKSIIFNEGKINPELKTLIESFLPPDTFYSVRIYSSKRKQTITTLTNMISQNFTSNSDTVALRRVRTVSRSIVRKELAKLDVILIIDRSGSMGFEDPPRIYYAKEAAKTFVDQLNATRDTVGLVSFGWEGTLDHPLSNDFNSVKSEIDNLIAYGATNMGGGIETANIEFNSNHRNNTIMAMILLSDGMANVDRDGNYYSEDEDRTPAIQYVVEEANEAGNMSVIIYTIGLGNETSHFDEDLLRTIVRNGGHYYHAPSARDLEDIYEKIALDLLFQVQYDIVVIELTLVKAS